MNNIYSIAITLFLLLGFVSPNSAHAQQNDAFSVGIIPPVIEIQADPPAIVESEITVVNENEFPQMMDIIYKSFRLAPDRNGKIEYIQENGNLLGPDPLILQKIKIFDGDNEIKQLELKGYESKSLKLEITLDKDSPKGDYYFSLIFVTQATISEDKSASKNPAGIGTNIILSVGKKGDTKGEIIDFSSPTFLGAGPVPFSLLIRNNSEHYIVPTGRITIKNMLGKDIGRVDILPQYILANSERFMTDTDQASTSALLSLPKTLIWPEKFLFGMYTATAHIKLGEGGPVFETSHRFFAIPLYFVFAVSFMAFVLLGIYLKVKKRI